MKIERTAEPLCFWKSIVFSLICSIFVFGLWIIFLILLMFANLSYSFISSVVGFMLYVNIGVFIVLLVGHFFYYNFDSDWRVRCVVCHRLEYFSTMQTLKDDDSLESVYICNRHKIVEVN